MEVGGWSHSDCLGGKSSKNSPKQYDIYIPYSVCIYIAKICWLLDSDGFPEKIGM